MVDLTVKRLFSSIHRCVVGFWFAVLIFGINLEKLAALVLQCGLVFQCQKTAPRVPFSGRTAYFTDVKGLKVASPLSRMILLSDRSYYR